MEIIPAIDLIDGKCVRLYQGDYAQKTVYDDDPVAVALRFERQGARRIHIVDLDGAKAGKPQNLDVAHRVCDAVGVPVQMGGGVRDLDTARAALDAGIDRVMLGTVAVREPSVALDACAEFGADAVVVAIDSRDGAVAVSGWTSGSETRATELLALMYGAGVRAFLCTDISRDGTLSGPNYALTRELVEVGGDSVIAAGGIASVEHLRRLDAIGVGGAVIGRALYTGDIDLREAVEYSSHPHPNLPPSRGKGQLDASC